MCTCMCIDVDYHKQRLPPGRGIIIFRGWIALYCFQDDDNEEDVLCTEKRENKYLFTTLSCIYIISQTIYNDIFF